MDRNQRIIVLLIIAGGIGTIFGAWWLSQRPESASAPFEATPFRAQPGTEREHQLDFITEPATRSSGQEADPNATTLQAPVAELDEDISEEIADDLAEEIPDVVAQALSSTDPANGLESIATAMATASLAQASDLYAAAGSFYLQQFPPDEDASQAAFERAIESAVEPRQAQRAAVQLASLMVNRGEPIAALELLDRVMPSTHEITTPSRAAVRLRLFQGGLFEDAGDPAKARACFQEAWNNARIIYLAVGDDDAVSVYRQASLALARHLRNQGGQEASDEILTQMRATLGES